MILQSPNFYGCIEDLASRCRDGARRRRARHLHDHRGALRWRCSRRRETLEVDVACGEAQSFGVPVSFGGPHVGFMAVACEARSQPARAPDRRDCGQRRSACIRHDPDHSRAAHSPRASDEQHLHEPSAHGPTGHHLPCASSAGGDCADWRRSTIRSRATRSASSTEAGLRLPHAAADVQRVRRRGSPASRAVLSRCHQQGIQPGVALGELDDTPDHLLVCTTEMNDRAQIDRLVRELAA